MAEAEAMEAALRFARRRRLGPFGEGSLDRSQTEKALAAMIRAGHSFELARSILRMEPGSDPFIES
jgi:regulatory protein